MIGIISRANRTLFQKLAPMGKYKTGLVRPNITIDITGRDAKDMTSYAIEGALRAMRGKYLKSGIPTPYVVDFVVAMPDSETPPAAKNIQFANLQELGVLRAIIHRD